MSFLRINAVEMGTESVDDLVRENQAADMRDRQSIESVDDLVQDNQPVENREPRSVDSVDNLMRDNQPVDRRERRSADRKSFPHPIKVIIGRHQTETHEAFSRGISVRGIGIISKYEFPPKTIATIHIHSLKGQDVQVKAELRWCLPHGEGWFASGWIFLS